MELTKKDIKKFQRLYLKHFGIELTADMARTELCLLVRQVEIVFQPISFEQFENYLSQNVNEENQNELSKQP